MTALDTATGERRRAAGPVLRRAGSAALTIAIAFVVLMALWQLLLAVFDVSAFVGKSPLDVWQYLFADSPARGVRPTSLSAQQARAASFGALATTLGNAAIGFCSGMVLATAVAVGFVLYRPFEFAFLPIAMLLRSVPLVAMAPLLLLIFGQGPLGVAVIAAIVVLFPALVNIVLGLTSASPQALDLVRVNGGSALTALVKVRVPAALPQFLASARISVPGAVVGSMLAEWLVGFEGMGGVLSGYKGQGNYGGVWTIVALSVLVSIVLYEVFAVVEAALLARWGPEAGLTR
ncbi:ABC transporter permease [Pseudonocardia lacus]|uniref:ABC transporter permease n=1 Tax=Pseudonocardia lacus TaxID=2835865 RepID=UPI001BDCC159|nr:ABC transporter permease subunit [Pseudonocardia lacus]